MIPKFLHFRICWPINRHLRWIYGLELPDIWASSITGWLVVQDRETFVVNLLPGGNNAPSCGSVVIARHRGETLVSCLIVRLTFNSKSCVSLPWPRLELIHAFSHNARVLINLGKLAGGYGLTTHQLASWIRGCEQKFPISLLSQRRYRGVPQTLILITDSSTRSGLIFLKRNRLKEKTQLCDCFIIFNIKIYKSFSFFSLFLRSSILNISIIKS